jgi:hypothetical protein
MSIPRRSHSRTPDKHAEHVRGGFLLGLTIAALNPTFLATWATALAAVRGMGFILDAPNAPAFAFGVLLGPILWFRILLQMLSSCAESLHPKILAGFELALPIVLFVLAAGILSTIPIRFLYPDH